MAETRDPRAEADPIGIVIGIRDRWLMNPLTTRLRRLLPYLTCAKRVCAQELVACVQPPRFFWGEGRLYTGYSQEKRVRTVQERKRDEGVTNRRYKPRSADWWSFLLGMWGFSRFSFESFSPFFLSLRDDSSPFLYQQVLNSRFGDQVHENLATISKFSRQYESTALQSDLVWFISFVSLQTWKSVPKL